MNMRRHLASVLLLTFCGHGIGPISALASGAENGTCLMVEWSSLTPSFGWAMQSDDTIHFGADMSYRGVDNWLHSPTFPANDEPETAYQLTAGERTIHPAAVTYIALPHPGDRVLDTVTYRAVAPPQFGRNLIKAGDAIMHAELPALLAWTRPFVELGGWIVKGAGSLIKWIGPEKCVDEIGTFIIDARNVGGVIVATIAPLRNCEVRPTQRSTYSIILTGAGQRYDVGFKTQALYPDAESGAETRTPEQRAIDARPAPIWNNDIDPGIRRYTRENSIPLVRTPY